MYSNSYVMACNHHPITWFWRARVCVTVIHEVHQLISCQKASKSQFWRICPPVALHLKVLLRQNRRSIKTPKRSATKAELQQQIKELQRKLNEAQGMPKDRDRDELEDGTLREELEAYQEQASQEWVEREWLHKVLETAEAEIADLQEDLDQAHWVGGVAATQNWMAPGPKSQCVKRWRTGTWTSWWTLLKEKLKRSKLFYHKTYSLQWYNLPINNSIY